MFSIYIQYRILLLSQIYLSLFIFVFVFSYIENFVVELNLKDLT